MSSRRTLMHGVNNEIILPLVIEDIIYGYVDDLIHQNSFKESLGIIKNLGYLLSFEPDEGTPFKPFRYIIRIFFNTIPFRLVKLAICGKCGEYYIDCDKCTCIKDFEISSYNKFIELRPFTVLEPFFDRW